MDFERDTKTLLIGERITIKTFRGVKGNIIGRLPDGRTALFNRDSPYMSMLSTNQTVDCSVNHIAEKYIIVDPIREPKELEIEVPTIEVEPVDREERNEIEGDERFDNLRRLSDEGEWEISIFARALLHIIEMFDALKAKPPKSSSQNVRLLTVKQTRYLKSNHLKGLDGYDDIDRFTAFFVEASALERREYGNVFYASTGTNSWNKLHKVIVERF